MTEPPPLPLAPIKARLAKITERYELAQFYEDPRMQIPVDLLCLIDEVEALRAEIADMRAAAYTIRGDA